LAVVVGAANAAADDDDDAVITESATAEGNAVIFCKIFCRMRCDYYHPRCVSSRDWWKQIPSEAELWAEQKRDPPPFTVEMLLSIATTPARKTEPTHLSNQKPLTKPFVDSLANNLSKEWIAPAEIVSGS